MRLRLVPLLLALALAGCAKKTPDDKATPAPAATPAASVRSIENRDWDLIALGEKDNPLGAGGQPATQHLDASAKRAAGNAGCNRYSAGYVLKGDSLAFAAAMTTRMACPDGMELESAWLTTLPKLVTWSATDTSLTLNGPEGPLARFAEHKAPGAIAPVARGD
jgi:putative lipoprotein